MRWNKSLLAAVLLVACPFPLAAQKVQKIQNKPIPTELILEPWIIGSETAAQWNGLLPTVNAPNYRSKAYPGQHLTVALAYVPGSMRYEVLRRAGGRCELCGISKDEAPLDIDHIQPRKYGGKTVPENLQALCARCNTIKGARDNTDFRDLSNVLER